MKTWPSTGPLCRVPGGYALDKSVIRRTPLERFTRRLVIRDIWQLAAALRRLVSRLRALDRALSKRLMTKAEIAAVAEARQLLESQRAAVNTEIKRRRK